MDYIVFKFIIQCLFKYVKLKVLKIRLSKKYLNTSIVLAYIYFLLISKERILISNLRVEIKRHSEECLI